MLLLLANRGSLKSSAAELAEADELPREILIDTVAVYKHLSAHRGLEDGLLGYGFSPFPSPRGCVEFLSA